jgi:hypothetical protein
VPAVSALIFVAMTPVWLLVGPAEARAWGRIREKAASGDEAAERSLRRRERAQASSWASYLLTLGLLYGTLALLDDQPWFPSERIATSDDQIIGYVVEESNGELVVLLEKHRTLMRVPNDPQATRTLCTINGEPRTLAHSILWRSATPDYPDCTEQG